MNNKKTIYNTDYGIGAADAIVPLNQWHDDDTDDVQTPAKKSHELEYLENVWSNFCLYKTVRGALNKKLLLAAMIPCGMMALNRFKEMQVNILLLALDVNLGVWAKRMSIVAEALKDVKLSMRKDFQNYLRERTLPFDSDWSIEESDSSLLDDVFEEVYKQEIKPKVKFSISLSKIFQILGAILNDLHLWLHGGTNGYEDIYNGIIRLCFGNSELAECSARFSSSYDTWRSKDIMNGSREVLIEKMRREFEILQKSPIGDCALFVIDKNTMSVSQPGVGFFIMERWKELIGERRPTVMEVLRCRKIFSLLRVIVMDKRVSEDMQKLNMRVPTKAKPEPAPINISEESRKLFKVKELIPTFVKIINEKVCTYINIDGEKWEWDVVMYVCKGLNIIHKKPGRKQFALMIEEICPQAQKILSSMSNPKEPTKNIPFDCYKQYSRVESYISRYVDMLKPLESFLKNS